MIHVHLPPESEDARLEGLLRRAAAPTLAHQKADPNAELSIALSNDELLQQLNKSHRGQDRPTDVLSFEGQGPDPETGRPYLGDVVISEGRAAAQADAASHSLEDELQLLAVHGILHLLGHDHAEPEDKRRMWAAQDSILQDLGVSIAPEALEKVAAAD